MSIAKRLQKPRHSLQNDMYKNFAVLNDFEFQEWEKLFTQSRKWQRYFFFKTHVYLIFSDCKGAQNRLYFCKSARPKGKFCYYSKLTECCAKVRMIYGNNQRWTLKADDAGMEHLACQGLLAVRNYLFFNIFTTNSCLQIKFTVVLLTLRYF